MRRLFVERAQAFFASRLGVSAAAAHSLRGLDDKLEAADLQRSKVVRLLPAEDLRLMASEPCAVDLWADPR